MRKCIEPPLSLHTIYFRTNGCDFRNMAKRENPIT